MNRLSPLFFCLVSVIGLAGCDTVLNGRISATEAFKMVDRKGKEFTVPATSQDVKLSLEDLGAGGAYETLKLQLEDSNGKKRKVEMKVESDVIPDRNGDFHVEGAKVGQPFDLVGSVATTESDSDRVRSYESCTYYVRQYRCWYEQVRDSRGRVHTVRRCGYVDVGYPGQREVEYHTHTVKVDAGGNFEASGHSVASWSAGASQSTTVVDARGFCR
jgi:hypothetical protein